MQMRKITQEQLNIILEDHKLWLENNYQKGKRADLRWASLQNANLRGAYLRGADLRKADLRWASLQNANLTRAYLRGATLSIEKSELENPYYEISYYKEINYLCIGCKTYTPQDWFSFSDQEIEAMDKNAFEFWIEEGYREKIEEWLKSLTIN
jgi:hypothetical protein